jgi:hypothetical protein
VPLIARYRAGVPARELDPGADALSALPSPGARAAAFASILVAGAAGAVIGYTLVRIQCDGDCGLPLGIGLLTGAVAAAGGMSVVAVLVLRALGEWREVQQREQAVGR